MSDHAEAASHGASAASCGDWAAAAQWYERAWRTSRRHPLYGLNLAVALRRLGQPGTLGLLRAALGRPTSGPAALILASALHQAGSLEAAARLLGTFLASTAAEPTATVLHLAPELALVAGAPGWLGWSQGQLLFGPAEGAVLDPRDVVFRVGRETLRPSWTPSSTKQGPNLWTTPFPAQQPNAPSVVAYPMLLGSPLHPGQIARVEGLVEVGARTISGWAWHPGDPTREPQLQMLAGSTTQALTAAQPGPADPAFPFARPRAFTATILSQTEAVRIATAAGQDLAGSPLRLHSAPPTAWPASLQRRQRTAILCAFDDANALTTADLRAMAGYGAACIVVVAGGIPAPPALRRAARACGAVLLALPDRQGLAAALNRGASAVRDHDLLVLRGRAHLQPGALPLLAEANHAGGIAAPLSNGWVCGGYPDAGAPASLSAAEALAIAQAAARGGLRPEIAADLAGAVLHISADCFAALGGFLEDAFVSFEATLLEFARRAARAGWSLRVVPASFCWDRDPEDPPQLLRERVARRDAEALARLPSAPPGRPLSAQLADARRTLEVERCLAASAGSCSTLLITHDEGGGLERHIKERVAALRRRGRATVLLRSTRRAGIVRLTPAQPALDNLAFELPGEWELLLDVLGRLRLTELEIHHLHRHRPEIARLPELLGLPYDLYLHDYALLCPRVTLISTTGQFCCEPKQTDCERCAAAYPDTPIVAPKGVAELRRESGDLFIGARRVIAPSADTAGRFARQYPGRRICVRPWEPVAPAARPVHPVDGITRVCVVGAISHAKGYAVLLECVRDAATRALPILFKVVGHTADDRALMAAGPIFVTGPYEEAERSALIARQEATVGFLPSIWPEPWCYALTGLLVARLPTLCFALGAQAGRVRAAGGMVMPLQTSPECINNLLLQLAHADISVMQSKY